MEEAYRSGTAGPHLFSDGAGSSGTVGTAGLDEEPHKDPLLRFVTATRGTVTKDDLGQNRWVGWVGVEV